MNEMGLRHLAYLGGGGSDLKISERTTSRTSNGGVFPKMTTEKVKAGFQAKLLDELEPLLSDAEKEIARRGRNLPIPVARRANQGEYRLATAFETLIGWWYYYDKNRLESILQILENHIK